ncbi:MAG TPA: hypothetical protein PL124_08135 [Candidatus Cloacimonadota bacterium]|nr:hypothetical protein [Candidatus Cloacimonadota bacterium]
MKRYNILLVLLLIIASASAGTFSWYSQSDSRWNKDRLAGGSSIGNSGCVLSCLSMLLNGEASNSRVTPDMLNDWLKKNGGYIGNDMRWQIAGKMDGDGNGMELVSESRKRNDWSYLSGELTKGNKVIVKVAGRASHWVLVIAQNGPDNKAASYIVNDPGQDSFQERTLAYFGGFISARSYSGNWLDETALNMESDIFVEPVVSDEYFLYDLNNVAHPADVYVTLSNKLPVDITGYFLLGMFDANNNLVSTVDYEPATVGANGSIDLIYQLPNIDELNADGRNLKIIYSKYFSAMPSLNDTVLPPNQRLQNKTNTTTEAVDESLN